MEYSRAKILVFGVEFKDIYEVEIGLGYGNRVVEIPAQSAAEAFAVGRGYDGVEHYVYSVKGMYHDWPGKDQLPSLRRCRRTQG